MILCVADNGKGGKGNGEGERERKRGRERGREGSLREVFDTWGIV